MVCFANHERQFLETPFYGVEQMTWHLQNGGHDENYKRILRLMRLTPIYQKPDMEAMRRVFDTDGDGKLTEADARWGAFRVMVTNADGTTTTKSLSELGITEINLRPDVTRITLPDGSRHCRDLIYGVEQMEIRRAA